jgi:large subunit ribosomal protein L15
MISLKGWYKMTVNKRKKNSRQRGSKTHGWGSKKKHRGAGNRGGRGMAGTGKRADSIKPSIWKDPDYFGKHGFIMHGQNVKINPINLSYLQTNADKLLAEKKIAKEGDTYVIDAEKLGYNKVLGCCKLTKKFNISAPYFSKGAIEKIEKSGGKAIITKHGKAKLSNKEEKKPEAKHEKAKLSVPQKSQRDFSGKPEEKPKVK